jgi:UDP-glucose 4-epimerase
MVVLGAMSKHNVRNLLFSSSSTAYGDPTLIPGMIPVPEDCPLTPINPYGHTKVMGEIIIKNLFDAKNAEEERTGSNEKWNAGLLRYFNPCGAHPNGIMGEDLRGRLHLIPALAHVALGKLPKLMFYGDGDYIPKIKCIYTCD